MSVHKCPVCDGLGKVDHYLTRPIPGVPSTNMAAKELRLCHGCGGKGWVAVQNEWGPPELKPRSLGMSRFCWEQGGMRPRHKGNSVQVVLQAQLAEDFVDTDHEEGPPCPDCKTSMCLLTYGLGAEKIYQCHVCRRLAKASEFRDKE